MNAHFKRNYDNAGNEKHTAVQVMHNTFLGTTLYLFTYLHLPTFSAPFCTQYELMDENRDKINEFKCIGGTN